MTDLTCQLATDNRKSVVLSYSAQDFPDLSEYVKVIRFLKREFDWLDIYVDNQASQLEHPCGAAEWYVAASFAMIFVVFISLDYLDSEACNKELDYMIERALVDGIPIVFLLKEKLPDHHPFYKVTLARFTDTNLAILSEITDQNDIHNMALKVESAIRRQIENPKYTPILSLSKDQIKSFLAIYPKMKRKTGTLDEYAAHFHRLWRAQTMNRRRVSYSAADSMEDLFNQLECLQITLLSLQAGPVAKIEPMESVVEDLQDKLVEDIVQAMRRLPGGEFPVNLQLLADAIGVLTIDAVKMVADGRLDITNGRFRIYLNASHGNFKRRFTLSHELGHAFLCRSNPDLDQHVPWIESVCNRVAAELLMPAAKFHEYFEEHKIDPYSLKAGSDRFEVSTEAVAVRWSHLFGVSVARVHLGRLDWKHGALFEQMDDSDVEILLATCTNGSIGRESIFLEGPKLGTEILWERDTRGRIYIVGF